MKSEEIRKVKEMLERTDLRVIERYYLNKYLESLTKDEQQKKNV